MRNKRHLRVVQTDLRLGDGRRDSNGIPLIVILAMSSMMLLAAIRGAYDFVILLLGWWNS